MQTMNTVYSGNVIEWRLKQTMERLGVTRYALQKHSGVAMNTIRSMYDGSTSRPDLKVMDILIHSLNEMGHSVGLSDLLEYSERDLSKKFTK
jgi:DNA-binding Xre family transcriptional regulator